MPLTFDQFFAGIAQQESGGDYSAINGSTGALGKYQILPSNVGYWSQKYLGTRWSPQQFLNDPRKQDALARAVLEDYFNRYGVRGAAAAWYSGNPGLSENYKPQPGGPSIGTYVDSVIAHALGKPQYADMSAFSSSIPTTTIDNTVKSSSGMKPEGNKTSGVAVGDTPGAAAWTGSGAEAVGAQGAQAVGDPLDATVDGPGAPTEPLLPSQGSSTTGTAFPVAHGARGASLAAVQKWLGVPYVFGGGSAAGPSSSSLAHGNYNQVGFDCSGFVQYLLAQGGVNAPRLSYDQLAMGKRVSLAQLLPGDLVGFGDGGHIAFYLGNGKIAEAPKTGESVRIRALGTHEDAFGVSLASYY